MIRKINNKIRGLKENIKGMTLKNKISAILLSYAIFAPMNLTYAADAKWNAMINFILPWISRLGGVVLLIGAVEFGLAFKSDDAEGKTKGMRTAIAGCIVIAVGLSSSTFLY